MHSKCFKRPLICRTDIVYVHLQHPIVGNNILDYLLHAQICYSIIDAVYACPLHNREHTLSAI